MADRSLTSTSDSAVDDSPFSSGKPVTNSKKLPEVPVPPAAETASLAQHLARPESKQYLDQLDQLSTDPQYTRGVPPDTTDSLKLAINQAKQAYDTKVNQNEWLDVAQTLGRAVAQFGAAQSGMAGGNRQNMSELNMGQPIDYNARSDRAFREYQSQLKGAEGIDALNRQHYLDTASAKNENYKRKEDYLTNALKSAREHETLESQESRADKRAQLQQNSEDRRYSETDKRANQREDFANKKLELGDLSKQEMDLRQKLEAARSLSNSALSDDDLGKKSRDKVQEKYGVTSAKAGVDPAILGEISEQSKDKGVLGTGIFRSENKEKKAQLLNERVIAPIKTLLDGIQARKRELLHGQSDSAAPAPVTDKVRVRNPAGQEGMIPRSQLEAALKQKYTEVK